jgi:hypothetical protein
MPLTEAANQRIREAQRAKILRAAWKAFARKGRAMTMADVATAANVSYGLTYRYFASARRRFFTRWSSRPCRPVRRDSSALWSYRARRGNVLTFSFHA